MKKNQTRRGGSQTTNRVGAAKASFTNAKEQPVSVWDYVTVKCGKIVKTKNSEQS